MLIISNILPIYKGVDIMDENKNNSDFENENKESFENENNESFEKENNESFEKESDSEFDNENNNNFILINDEESYKLGNRDSESEVGKNQNVINISNSKDNFKDNSKDNSKYKSKDNDNMLSMSKFRFFLALLSVILITGIVSGAVSYTVWDYYGNGGTRRGSLLDSSFSFLPNDTSSSPDADLPTELEQGERIILTVPQINMLVRPGIVFIGTSFRGTNIFGQSQTQTGSGSGIIISEDGYVVTNNHVVENAESIIVKLFDGESYDATLVGRDPGTDLAVLKINASGLTSAKFGNSDDIHVGELAVAIGNPLGTLEGTLTTGVVSALNRSVSIDNVSMSLIQTDAALNPGNSGGALVNQYGEVIGVVNAKTSAVGIEGLGYAIPVNDVKIVVQDIINNGYVTGRIKIGIATRDITEDLSDYYKLPIGVYVVDVEKGSSADKAGLVPGDVIIGIDGEDVLTSEKLSEVRDEHEPGDEIMILIIREGQEKVVKLTFEEDRT